MQLCTKTSSGCKQISLPILQNGVCDPLSARIEVCPARGLHCINIGCVVSRRCPPVHAWHTTRWSKTQCIYNYVRFRNAHEPLLAATLQRSDELLDKHTKKNQKCRMNYAEEKLYEPKNLQDNIRNGVLLCPIGASMPLTSMTTD